MTGEPALLIFDYLHLKFGQIQSLPQDSLAVKRAISLVRMVNRQPNRSPYFWSEKTYQWLSTWWQCAVENELGTQKLSVESIHPSRLLSHHPGTVEKFAMQMGYSREYLTRKLAEQWGRSPGSVMREVKLNHAGELLRTTSLTVADIADKVGYANATSFARAFIRQMGQSPRKYRHGG